MPVTRFKDSSGAVNYTNPSALVFPEGTLARSGRVVTYTPWAPGLLMDSALVSGIATNTWTTFDLAEVPDDSWIIYHNDGFVLHADGERYAIPETGRYLLRLGITIWATTNSAAYALSGAINRDGADVTWTTQAGLVLVPHSSVGFEAHIFTVCRELVEGDLIKATMRHLGNGTVAAYCSLNVQKVGPATVL